MNKILSKFPHEEKALQSIIPPLESQVEFIQNYDLYDPATNYYYECDLIAVCSNFIAIVELKHWSGEIEVSPYNWQVNGRFRKDPHQANKYKCQVLKGFIEREFPYLKSPWVESVVVLTNPEATVHNDSSHKNASRNPTFADTDTLVKFFKYRLSNVEDKTLTTSDRKKIKEKLVKQQEVPRAKTIQIPGYDILENLTQTDNRIELLARVAGIELQTIKRLRIFLTDPDLSDALREQQRVKSQQTLKILDRLGSHPNIIKVEPVPNDDGLLIEVSDWSEDGSLSDVLKAKGAFSVEKSTEIAQGIVSALVLLHQEAVVHRDLRPENIMMDGDTPKLINFDYTYLPDDHTPEYTVFPDAKSLQASPFIAPELYIDGQFDETADLFSVGVILYTMLCGEPPFGSSLDLLKSGGLPDSTLARLKQLNLPAPLTDLITSLIRFDRTKRTLEASDVLAVLQGQITDPAYKQVQGEKINKILQLGDSDRGFEIVEFLGQGREAQVYRARQIGDRKVALKLFMQKVPRERVVEEWKNLEQLKNPYILHVQYLSQWSDGRFFLVTNLVEGSSLRVMIQKKHLPSLEEFRHVASCLLQAVDAMHKDPAREKPLLHNDIKPDNILLSENNDPVLIDLGTACHPQVSSYMGTDLYTAPDLLCKVDFEFCESGDLFALAITLFEWFCGTRPYDGVATINAAPKLASDFRQNELSDKLIGWFDQAVQPKRESRFVDISAMQEAFDNIWVVAEKGKESGQVEAHPSTEKDTIQVTTPRKHQNESSADEPKDSNHPGDNPFVRYLNSFHNATAEDENSLAESQAQNPFFGTIHIPLPQTDYIFEQLTKPEGNHVILTGHAGDGKSTIGLELYKKIQNISFEVPLRNPLKDHEIISSGNVTVHIVKDMSELGAGDRCRALADAVDPNNNSTRWLIISNTGTLISTFEEIAKEKNENKLLTENTLLKHLGANDPAHLSLFNTPFTLINLARTDNIAIGMSIFKNILNHTGWHGCLDCDLHTSCPVQQNVKFLKDNKTCFQRISMIYRRLNEYGVRLTIRQITGHLAYSLTSGFDCEIVHDHAVAAAPPNAEDGLFSNSFFGHKGIVFDKQANRLAAIQHIAELEMGSSPFPSFDRKLWSDVDDLQLLLPNEDFQTVANRIAGQLQTGIPTRRIRQAMRRFYYMFADFGLEERALSSFLDSQMLISVEKWQQNGGPSRKEKSDLLRKVLHVLQEEYTGFKLGANSETNQIYITLRRRQEGYRQSVQLLLAEIPLASFSLEWRQTNNQFQPIGHLLILKEQVSGAEMPLDLPFLDFVLMRDMGEVGQRLNPGYKDRLEKFKSQLLSTPNYKFDTDERIELLELDCTGKLNTKSLLVEGQQLQVIK
ncbi:MAG: protein kinase [Chlorobium sp.]|nr:protein kinase [Chlorobium sp.]